MTAMLLSSKRFRAAISWLSVINFMFFTQLVKKSVSKNPAKKLFRSTANLQNKYLIIRESCKGNLDFATELTNKTSTWFASHFLTLAKVLTHRNGHR